MRISVSVGLGSKDEQHFLGTYSFCLGPFMCRPVFSEAGTLTIACHLAGIARVHIAMNAIIPAPNSSNSSSLDAVALELAADFHFDVSGCSTPEELHTICGRYRDKVLLLHDAASQLAATFLSIFPKDIGLSLDQSTDATRWREFEELASKAHNRRDRRAQALRHQAGIIAFWGPAVFRHYSWHALPVDLTRRLHDLTLLVPRWEDAVRVINRQMLARHEQRVLCNNYKAHKIGEHATSSTIQDPRSPVERKDIIDALDCVRQCAHHSWDHINDAIRGAPIWQFSLTYDDYGMIVPDVGDDEILGARLTKRPRLHCHVSGQEKDLLPAVEEGEVLPISDSGQAIEDHGVLQFPGTALQHPSREVATSRSPLTDKHGLNSGETLNDVSRMETTSSASQTADESQILTSDPQVPSSFAESCTIEKVLRVRHSATIDSFSQENRHFFPTENQASYIADQRRPRHTWLQCERWASIYSEPNEKLGTGSASKENADIWYLDSDAVQHYVRAGHIFDRPVVIKQSFQDCGMYNLADYTELLSQQLASTKGDIDQGPPTGAYHSMTIEEYQHQLSRLDPTLYDAAPPALPGAANLPCLASADQPLLTRLAPFRLLPTLLRRLRNTLQSKVMTDPDTRLAFNHLSPASSFSPPQAHIRGGTWRRVLFGVQTFVIATNLDEVEWLRYVREGGDAVPEGKLRIVVLERDDVLFLPPGVRVVHASLALETTLMEGGVLWDERNISGVLDELVWGVENGVSVEGGGALLLPGVLGMLEKWLDGQGYRQSSLGASLGYKEDAWSKIKRLRELGCT
ncbi:hypothetical protein K461DRAFT_292336 [Myriangium duriaei CBS 260.36]|uniref:Uncharacterized protein n=1 Tax=Myriangium duriaei CBS 260.36 TaxID=1168546 RepID=A0A9P4J4W4_9PEZI|nr:hypothetical protein K461DRAFT_292336 [Myriangium duriaei CBS 260.36]